MRLRAAKLLGHLVDDGHHPLLIVDGLNEQGNVAPTVTQVLSGLISDDVACIATTRRNPDPTSRLAPDDPLRDARKLRLGPLSLGDVKDLLGRRNLDAGLAAEVYRLTNGNALYVRSLAFELADRGDSVLRDLSIDAPADVTAYFDRRLGLPRGQIES